MKAEDFWALANLCQHKDEADEPCSACVDAACQLSGDFDCPCTVCPQHITNNGICTGCRRGDCGWVPP